MPKDEETPLDEETTVSEIVERSKLDVDMDNPGAIGVRKSNGGPILATFVLPNLKCNSCLHYNSGRTVCSIGTLPSVCGDGTAPETGYAPLVPTRAQMMVWDTNRDHVTTGVQARVVADNPNASDPTMDFEVQHLGDPSELLAVDIGFVKAVPPVGPKPQKIKYTHQTKGAVYPKGKEKKRRDPTKVAKAIYNKWAVATAAWQKVSPGKKAKYTKAAMSRHRKAGEKIKPGKYVRRAPREYMEHIMAGKGLSSEESEIIKSFGFKVFEKDGKKVTIHRGEKGWHVLHVNRGEAVKAPTRGAAITQAKKMLAKEPESVHGTAASYSAVADVSRTEGHGLAVKALEGHRSPRLMLKIKTG